VETQESQAVTIILYGMLCGMLMVVLVGVVLGFGERRKIVIYSNYDDLFQTFLVPALATLSVLFLSGGFPLALLGYALLIGCVAIFGLIVGRTFRSNEGSLWKAALAMITKFPLAFLWVLQIISLINPRGQTFLRRAQNRASALLILTLLTPIVAALVAEKTGLFSPRELMRGKRIGGIREYL
jgi:hypothetical protein